jgi:hypothetical protein
VLVKRMVDVRKAWLGRPMQPDARWNATADSVRQDMTRMGGMSAAELQASMPEHRARMARLMDMHRTMMGSMQH